MLCFPDLQHLALHQASLTGTWEGMQSPCCAVPQRLSHSWRIPCIPAASSIAPKLACGGGQHTLHVSSCSAVLGREGHQSLTACTHGLGGFPAQTKQPGAHPPPCSGVLESSSLLPTDGAGMGLQSCHTGLGAEAAVGTYAGATQSFAPAWPPALECRTGGVCSHGGMQRLQQLKVPLALSSSSRHRPGNVSRTWPGLCSPGCTIPSPLSFAYLT